jgi:hypothetical protein
MSGISEHDEFSTHAVPTDARVATFRVAAVSSMVSFSLPTFIAGIEVAYGVGEAMASLGYLGWLVYHFPCWLAYGLDWCPHRLLTLICLFGWPLAILAHE